MKAIYLLIPLFFIVTFSVDAQLQDISGLWHGSAELPETKLRLSFDLRSSAGQLEGDVISPDQGDVKIPMEALIFSGDSLRFHIESINLSYKGSLDRESQVLYGEIIQNGRTTPLSMEREEQASAYPRPQTPKKPYPYYTEEIRFENFEAEISLAGTLSLPDSNSKAPIAVMITGSGPQDRDETIAFHRPFLVIADHLARNGYGTLRFDDRGIGKSEGDFSKATSRDFAGDVIAAIKYLESKGFKEIGVIGHSEGGLIAAMVGASYPIDFIISLAGTGVNGLSICKKQNIAISMGEGLPLEAAEINNRKFVQQVDIIMQEEDPERAGLQLHAFLDTAMADQKPFIPDFEGFKEQQIAQMNNPWMRFFLQHDPCDDWRKVKCPVLGLNGTLDLQVDLKMNFEAIQNCLIEAENEDFTLSALKNLNHLFQTSSSGRLSEYIELEETFSVQALKTMTQWLDNHYPKK